MALVIKDRPGRTSPENALRAAVREAIRSRRAYVLDLTKTLADQTDLSEDGDGAGLNAQTKKIFAEAAKRTQAEIKEEETTIELWEALLHRKKLLAD